MISSVIEAAKALVGAAGALQKLGDERRAKLASLFDAISTVLENFKVRRQQGDQSPGLCAELREYANALRHVASGTLPSPEIERLALELSRVCRALEMSAAGGGQLSSSYENYLDQLAEGAGAFRGCANVLRAK